jgi:hypothetical protein
VEIAICHIDVHFHLAPCHGLHGPRVPKMASCKCTLSSWGSILKQNFRRSKDTTRLMLSSKAFTVLETALAYVGLTPKWHKSKLSWSQTE